VPTASGSSGSPEPSASEGNPDAGATPAYLDRLNGWSHRMHFPPIAFYAELWR
jgi:hypothetical protein